MNICTANDLPEEEEIKGIVEDMLRKYDIPCFTDTVIIEKGVVPHSHPVLTLNTRSNEPHIILKTFIHEQMHWFISDFDSRWDVVNYLRRKYDVIEECVRDEENFYFHIIVCFNTRNVLKHILLEDDVRRAYESWQAYPMLEKFVEEHFEDIREDLEKFHMIVRV